LDERWGIAGTTSRQACRLLVLAGASWSFDRAVKHLQEFCGWSVSDTTIRAICHQQAAEMIRWQQEETQAHESFRQARGDVEFTTDGTMVNTTGGWREMRLGIFAKRPRGESATPATWDQRILPRSTACVAFAAIETSTRFGRRWSGWTEKLGVRDPAQLSILADGARWIWDEAALHLAGATEVLDVYHALEKIAATAHALFGENTETSRAWTEAARRRLLAEGWPGIRDHLDRSQAQHRKRAARQALQSLRNYLGRQPEHLRYAQRLIEGRSIGSGQVEGACRHMIARRLKNGGRWKVRRANRMAGLCGVLYSDLWDAYWKSA
jgi:hypothetical protein